MNRSMIPHGTRNALEAPAPKPAPRTPAQFLCVLILLAAGALRLVDLARVPPPLNVDEAVNAYEAYSILKTGRDEWGTPWPVTFRAFNDYRRPATIYSAVPFVALFGLNTFAIRAMAAFWGWLSVVLVYRLATDLFGRGTGLAAALVLTLSSWHVGFSRLGIEASGPLLSSIIAGLILGWRWYRTRKPAYLAGAALMFALSLYSYTIAQAFTPLLLVAVALIFAKPLRGDMRAAAVTCVIIAVLSLPLLVAITSTPDAWNRLNAISITADAGRDAWLTALKQGLGHFSPAYLFFRGDGTPIHHIQGYGQLFWIEMLLVPLGAVALIIRRTDRRAKALVLAWLLIAVVPAALTRQDAGSPNSMRSICAVPAWAILSGLGLSALPHLLPRRVALTAAMTGLLLGALVWNAGVVLRDYFVTYPIVAARAFEYGIEEAMDYVLAHENEVETIVLTDWISQPHSFAVFYAQVDPEVFQATHAPYGNRLSEKLTAWGNKYRTGNVEDLYLELDHGIFVVRPHMLEGVEPVLVILHPDGSPAFKVLRK